MRIDYGIQINHGGLKHLEPVIKGWGKAISTYCENWSDKDQDAPYYYNERPNVSLLAAGAWESGGSSRRVCNDERAARPLDHRSG